jgi:hypothetical protein
VTGEWQLGHRRKNAQARRVRRFGCGQDKNGFRQAELAGDRLHELRMQTFAVMDDREGIAGKPFSGEHVKSGESPFHRFVSLRFHFDLLATGTHA